MGSQVKISYPLWGDDDEIMQSANANTYALALLLLALRPPSARALSVSAAARSTWRS